MFMAAPTTPAFSCVSLLHGRTSCGASQTGMPESRAPLASSRLPPPYPTIIWALAGLGCRSPLRAALRACLFQVPQGAWECFTRRPCAGSAALRWVREASHRESCPGVEGGLSLCAESTLRMPVIGLWFDRLRFKHRSRTPMGNPGLVVHFRGFLFRVRTALYMPMYSGPLPPSGGCQSRLCAGSLSSQALQCRQFWLVMRTVSPSRS